MEGPDGRHSQVGEGEYPIKVSMRERYVEGATITDGRVRTDQVAGGGRGREGWRGGAEDSRLIMRLTVAMAFEETLYDEGS